MSKRFAYVWLSTNKYKKPQAKNTVAPSVATLEMIVGVLGIVAAVVKTLADATT